MIFMTIDRFIVLVPFNMLAFSALVAPRLQLFTDLVCKDLDVGRWDPENRGMEPSSLSAGWTRPASCAADPLVQAKVAKLLTSPPLLSCIALSYVLRNPY
jgi:hypothetical protein